MSLLKSVLTAGLVGFVLVAGLVREASAARQVATSGAVSVDDGTLQSRIAGNLKKSPSLAPRDIDVDVKQGSVTLTGTVRTATEKARAERLARVSGVTRVNNRIEVDPKMDRSKIDVAGDQTATVNPVLQVASQADAVVVVAGMEGALPSMVGGYVACPVIAVPTSIGYGASFGGVAALLGMLNSCANGVAVVNIDNGFGGAAMASLINHL